MELTLKNIPEIYKDYDSRVIEFLSNVLEDIEESNTKINKYFNCTFELLANQLQLYYMSKDMILEQKKLSSEDAYKRLSKHPAIGVLNRAHQSILDIMNKLSMSPIEKAKLNRIKNGDDEESAEELLNDLIK